ncbi:MAG TPA: methyltransferase domain-containing protein [Candidatus Acidoferrales bacterium]|jgi:SAM-dependent methyltransferase|nr:methyltransferase domain-containing protein [Candidatus Acidoferrales bacterium]
MSELDPSLKPTERFSGRVEAYRRFRSRYPGEIIPLLEERCALTRGSAIADIGAGTGMLAELFLENGNRVLAVEPNPDMRAACEELLPRYPLLTCIDGTAEETRLPEHSVDFVAIGRALHWFDQEKCRPEFIRILSAGGWVVLASQGPHMRSEPVILEFQTIIKEHGLDYARMEHRYDLDSAARRLFAGCEFHEAEFGSPEEMSYEELEGFMLSLSVIPQPGNPGFAAMRRALQEYFARHESGGKIGIPMTCKIHFGHLC